LIAILSMFKIRKLHHWKICLHKFMWNAWFKSLVFELALLRLVQKLTYSVNCLYTFVCILFRILLILTLVTCWNIKWLSSSYC
jgi:hypothetical protein